MGSLTGEEGEGTLQKETFVKERWFTIGNIVDFEDDFDVEVDVDVEDD